MLDPTLITTLVAGVLAPIVTFFLGLVVAGRQTRQKIEEMKAEKALELSMMMADVFGSSTFDLEYVLLRAAENGELKVEDFRLETRSIREKLSEMTGYSVALTIVASQAADAVDRILGQQAMILHKADQAFELEASERRTKLQELANECPALNRMFSRHLGVLEAELHFGGTRGRITLMRRDTK